MAFTGVAKDGSTTTYSDGKRWLWLTPCLSSGLYSVFGWLYFALDQNPLITLLPLLYILAVIPLLDAWLGEDPHNPPEEVVSAMASDRYYNVVVWFLLLPITAVYLGTMWFVATQSLPWWSYAVLAFAMGTFASSFAIFGHELGHRPDKWNQRMARLANGMVGMGHFTIEHNRGHHVRVATPEDCASSRMGETIYEFVQREMFPAVKGAWQHESLRMRNKKLPVLHWQNELLQSWAFTAVVSGLLIAWLGWKILPFLVAHHFFAWYALTQANYIEHYGLKREKLPNGKYEPCQPHHSWNTNHIFSNLLQVHLQRHSDHHANPMRPYQALRNFDELPRLPTGYPGCITLAAIPPLWFKVMNPRVMTWADGDLSKVNIHEPARARLEAEFEAST
jgi:alkane 1-monooxygenase